MRQGMRSGKVELWCSGQGHGAPNEQGPRAHNERPLRPDPPQDGFPKKESFLHALRPDHQARSACCRALRRRGPERRQSKYVHIAYELLWKCEVPPLKGSMMSLTQDFS